MGNRAEAFELFWAAAHLGITYVPVNWHWVADELAYVIEDSGATVLVVDDRFADVAVEALADPRAGAGVTLGAGRPAGRATAALADYEEFLAAADTDAAAEPRGHGWADVLHVGHHRSTRRACGARWPVARTSPARCCSSSAPASSEYVPDGRAHAAGRSRLPLGPVGVHDDADGQRLGGGDAPQVRPGRDRPPDRRLRHHQHPPRAHPVQAPARPARRRRGPALDGVSPRGRLARCRAVPAAVEAGHDRLGRSQGPRVLRLHRGVVHLPHPGRRVARAGRQRRSSRSTPSR